MPSFIHASDLHLDSALKGLEPYEGAPDIEEIRGATRQALTNLVALARETQVPLVLIAGDVYDGDWPDFSTGLFFCRQMQMLAQEGIHVAFVRGNHDAQNKMTRTLVMPDNVKVFSSRSAETFIYKDINIAVHGQSYADAETTGNLAVGYPDPVSGYLNIGLLHCLIAGTSGHQPYAPCTIDDLAAKGYDYWALGHVHNYTVLRRQPLIVYPGCSQGRHAKETGVKGCVLVEAENDRLSHEFIRLGTVQWLRLTVDISTAETMAQAVDSFGQTLESTLAVSEGELWCLRAVLQGRTPAHGHLVLHTEELTANIRAMAADVSAQRVWVEKVSLETESPVDLRTLAQSDSPQGELLRYMQQLQSPADLALDLTALKSKLAGSGIALPAQDDPQLLKGARDILISMLTDSGKTKGEQ